MEEINSTRDRDKKENKLVLKDFSLLFIMIGAFYTIAILLWILTGSIFYLINFIIIGTSIGLGMGLWPVLSKKKKDKARKLSQALVGGYLFFGLGLGLIYIFFGTLSPENMQIEGFFFWLFAGQFAAAVLHYTIAKIIGPVLFNRGWCGWACWTAAVLDYLPWKKSPKRKPGKWGHLRYITFIFSMILVIIFVFVLGINLFTNFGIIDLTGSYIGESNIYQNFWLIPELWWFLIGNAIYYGAGIILAAVLKDNRAFCKYLCPICALFKIGSRFSIMKIKVDQDKCTQCGACEKICPMDIEITEYTKRNERVLSTECIFCLKCINVCPKQAISASLARDFGKQEFLRIQGS